MANTYVDMQDQYKTYTTKNPNQYGMAGVNGLTGFNAWECYMLVKYGSGKFGKGGKSEYLIELPLYPEDVTEQISANWQTQKVLGRSAAISAYANTELKSVSFSLDLHRDLLTGSFSHTKSTLKGVNGKQQWQAAGYQVQTAKGPFSTRSWYVNANKMLQISCYPQYTKNGLIPPTTYFIFGQMILKGFVRNYSTTWKKPIINNFYGWNSVQISMDCYPDTIISADNIMTNAGAASTQNTYNTVFPGKEAAASDVMRRKETMNRNNLRTDKSLGGSLRQT